MPIQHPSVVSLTDLIGMPPIEQLDGYPPENTERGEQQNETTGYNTVRVAVHLANKLEKEEISDSEKIRNQPRTAHRKHESY